MKKSAEDDRVNGLKKKHPGHCSCRVWVLRTKLEPRCLLIVQGVNRTMSLMVQFAQFDMLAEKKNCCPAMVCANRTSNNFMAMLQLFS